MPTIDEIADAYLKDAEGFRDIAAPQTMRNNLRKVRERFGALPFDEFKVGRNTRVREFVAWRRGEGVSDSTVNAECRALQTALNFAAREEMIDSAPKILRPKAGPPRSRTLSPAELDRFYAEVTSPRTKEHVRLALELGLRTGQRRSAVNALKWIHCDFEAGVIRFSRTTDRITKKRRIDQPMHPALRQILLEARPRAECEYVVSWRGKPVRTVRTAFQEICERAGIEGLTIHDLRRTGATLVRRKEGLNAAAEFIGDSISQTDRTYAKADPMTNLTAMNAIDDALSASREEAA